MNINATLLGQAITFAILVWFTMRFVWPPLMKAMDARAKRIADGLAAAEKGHRDLQQSENRAKEILKEAREKAQEFITHAQKRSDEMIEEAKEAAKVEGERQLVAARANIEQEVNLARDKLRDQVAALAVLGAEQVLMREVDQKKHKEVLSRLSAQL